MPAFLARNKSLSRTVPFSVLLPNLIHFELSSLSLKEVINSSTKTPLNQNFLVSNKYILYIFRYSAYFSKDYLYPNNGNRLPLKYKKYCFRDY
jgi:hypothetical protein